MTFINKTSDKCRQSYIIFICLMLLIVSCASVSKSRGKMQPWVVTAVSFSGNTSISSFDILDVMETKPGNFFKTNKYSQSNVNADSSGIVNLYRNKGFVNIKVQSLTVVKDPLSRHVTVGIIICEGAQTRIGTVSIKGNSVLSEAEIKHIIHLKLLSLYSTDILAGKQQIIRDSLAGHGYSMCVVDRKDNIDTVAHLAAVIFTVNQGPLVKAGPVMVNGAKKLRDVITKRGLTFKTGDTLTSTQIRLSMRQMYESGMFKYVQITTPVADSAKIRQLPGPVSLPVHVDIQESDFFKVQGGVGYGTYEGVRLTLQTSYGNVFGLGQTIGLDGKYSQLLQSLHLHYIAPWFLLLPPTAEAELFGEHHNEVTFTGYIEGFTMSLLSKTPWNIDWRVFSTFEFVNDVKIQPAESSLTSLIHGNNTQSFGTVLTYDLRDNLIDPLKGMFVSSEAELAGLIGTQTNHFYKCIFDARGYVPVASNLHVASAVTIGYVNGWGIDNAVVPPQELLYAGSETIRPVRGYAPNTQDGIGDTTGGRFVLVVNVLELRLTIAKWLKIAGFVDAGYVWTAASLFSLNDLRYSAGPGLRFRTPVGILSTDCGIRINGPTKGKAGFSLGIGEPF